MTKNLRLVSLTLLIYGLPIYIFSVFPFSKKIYPNFEHFQSPILTYFYEGRIGYNSLGIIFDALLLYCVYLLFKPNIEFEKERVYLIFTGLKKMLVSVFKGKLKQESAISKEEKVSLLFYLVKLFWAPLMIIFAIENSNNLINFFKQKFLWEITPQNILNFYFPLYIAAIFTVDTVVFSFGYLVESPLLKNVVKSVEPTALGWLAALVCYGPFFDTFTRIAGPLPKDFADFGSVNLNIVFGFATLILFSVYVWATIALGFKASNLTNRGIVSTGPYKYVRHPAYIAKNLGWLVASIPFIQMFGFKTIIGVAIWALVYYVRAITEERHLSQDPEYVEYMKKVRYMFIPGVF